VEIKNLLICGKMRSGKTVTTQKLIKIATEYGYKAKRVSLAYWVKRLLARGFGRYDREAMQYFGTEIMREFAGSYFGTKDFWVNLMLADIEDLRKKGYNFFICDDGRFPEEIMCLRSKGFKVIRLVTTKKLQLSRKSEDVKSTVGLEHSSETILDKFENKGIFDLETKPEDSIDEIVKKIVNTFLKFETDNNDS